METLHTNTTTKTEGDEAMKKCKHQWLGIGPWYIIEGGEVKPDYRLCLNCGKTKET